MNVFSQLIKARLEQVSADLSETISGLIWNNTTSHRIKYYNGSAVKELVETDSAQTLTNKTITSPLGIVKADVGLDQVDNTSDATKNAAAVTLTNKTLTSPIINSPSISTPSRLDVKQDTFANLVTYALTAANGQLCFATDTKSMYQVIDTALASVGGSGSGINYVTNDLENNTTGYATYADAAASSPVDATGGSPVTTITTSSVSPLRGNKSGLITKDAANRQGNGVSYDFTIAPVDQAQVLRISFDYATSTNYADDDMRVYVYDITNAQLIEVVDRTISASASGKYVGSFQSNSNSLSYRLVLHVASTNATAYTVKIDNVIVGPQTLVKGPIVTSWQAYAPVVSGQGTAATGLIGGSWRRVGDSAELNIVYAISGTGGSGAGVVEFTVPSGLVVDDAKARLNNGVIGHGVTYNIPTLYATVGVQTSGNKIRLLKVGTGTNVTGADLASNSQIELKVTLPITGWSSNVILSEDSGNRLIEVIATGALNSSGTANVTPFILPTASRDTTGSYSTSTGKFTAPESGYYSISGYVNTNLTANQNIVPYIDGVATSYAIGFVATSSGIANFAGKVYAAKGQTIEIRASGAWTAVGANNFLSISKDASPQTLAGGVAVAVAANNTSGQTIPASNVPTTLLFDSTKEFDTHNALVSATGIWTCPISGYYTLSHSLSISTSVSYYVEYIVAGVMKLTSGTTTNSYNRGSRTFYVAKGETVYFRLSKDGAGTASLLTNAGYNTISIAKVG